MNLVKSKKGLVEAVLLPFLDFTDMCRLNSTNKTWRVFFDPSKGYNVNCKKLVIDRLCLSE